MKYRFVKSDLGGTWEPVDPEAVVPPSKFEDGVPHAPMISGDIEPYRSMVDGSIVGGRRQHRQHLRQHGCVEVGGESSVAFGDKGFAAERPKRAPVADTLREVLNS